MTIPLSANITAAPLVITVANDSKVYGSTTTQANHAYNNGSLSSGTGFTVRGLFGNDAVSTVTLSSQGALATAGVGGSPYTIAGSLAVGTGNLSNYIVSYVPGVLTVTPKTLTVTVDSKSMNYGDTVLPTLTSAVSGLVNGDTTTISLLTPATPYTGIAGSASPVNSYAITATTSSNRNYVVSSIDGVLTVNPVNLTIQANTQSTTYGAPLVLSQSALTATGLVNGDYVSSASILTNVSQTGQSGVNSQIVSGLTNAGNYIGNLLISNAAGVRLSNYTITYQAANLVVDKAVLTVSAVNDAKFIGQTDAAGYANSCGATTACAGGYGGVMYSGFKNADTTSSINTSGLVIARQNVTNVNSNLSGEPHAPDTYVGALQASGLVAANYTFNYVAGNYTIVPASQLLVKVGAVNTVYGTAPNYSNITAQYLYGNNTAPTSLSVTNSSGSITVSDGSGGSAQFSLIPVSPQYSGSGNLSVGSYGLQVNTAPNSLVITGNNFGNQFVVAGGLTVTPLQLTFNQLNIAGLSKVYDGSAYMSNLVVNAAANAFIAGDRLSVLATGTFATKNVQTNLSYTVGVLFDGLDAANYVVGNGATYSGANGSITQLNSVTYTGTNTGGAWSNPANWTTTGTNVTGAIPDLSNVANVIIPVGSTVVYDSTVAGPVYTAVANSGNLNINLSSSASMPMSINNAGNVNITGAGALTLTGDIAGSGSINITGAGALTLTGNNSYTGSAILNSGARLIAGANSAIGTGNIQSNGGSFGVLSGFVLPTINATGPLTLLSSITTYGSQSYGALTLGTTAAGFDGYANNTPNSVVTFTSLDGGNINMLGTLDGAANKTQSVIVNSVSGNITIGDSISSINQINSLNVTGRIIYILADILTSNSQTYTGNIYIGDASYINKPRVNGFLLDSYSNCCVYTIGSTQSKVAYKADMQVDKSNIRTLISVDPEIIFNGTVNDVVPKTHTLLLAAISPVSISSLHTPEDINNAAKIIFNGAVGNSAPLYSLNAQTISAIDGKSSNIGSITFTDAVTTQSNQTYRSNAIFNQSSNPSGGNVAFSVFDADATMTFFLPVQTSSNSHCTNNCGQVNMQDVSGGRNTLVFNGDARFISDNQAPAQTWDSIKGNTLGEGNWGARVTLAPAFDYRPPAQPPIEPPVQPPLSLVLSEPVTQPPYVQQQVVTGATLSEFMSNYVEYMNALLEQKGSVVTVSSPEEVALVHGKGRTKRGGDDSDAGGEPVQSQSGVACSSEQDGKSASCNEE